jgi:hypothetical protein
LIDNPGASFLSVGDARGGGMLGDAVGHVVEGEFITYIGTKSHRSPLCLPQRHKGTKKTGSQIYHKDAKTRRARELCAFVTWWFLTSLRARQVTPFKGSSSLMLGRKGMGCLLYHEGAKRKKLSVFLVGGLFSFLPQRHEGTKRERENLCVAWYAAQRFRGWQILSYRSKYFLPIFLQKIRARQGAKPLAKHP